MRLHRDYRAYFLPQQPFSTSEARLASLKLEALSVGEFRRRYVDAVLLDGETIVPVPFVRIAEDGDVLLHEFHLALGESICGWLKDTIAKWYASKPADADLEADIFSKDDDVTNAFVESSDVVRRAFPGVSAYAMLFDEAERYANLTPFVYQRRIADFSPGYGYGISTLSGIASELYHGPNSLQQIAQRLRSPVRELPPESKIDVAVWLDAPENQIETMVARLRDSVDENGIVIVSQRGQSAARRLAGLGADVLPMCRAGADAFGSLDEWLGVFVRNRAPQEKAPEHRSSISVSPRPLRVLFGLRPSAERTFGGDVVQVRETADALRKRGHFVEVRTNPKLDASGFDVVHLTNLTVPNETLPQAQSVADFDGAVFLMPIFTDHADEAAWGMHTAQALFLLSDGNDDLSAKLNALETRTLAIPGFAPPPLRNGMFPDYEKVQQAILPCIDYVLANAHSEMNRFYRYLGCDVPYAVAPSCANPLIYGAHRKQRFINRFGMSDFVLLPGRYEHRKNQIMFFEAAASLGLPILCIGRNYDPFFGYAMRKHRPRNVAYIGHLPEEDLAGAFAAARVAAVPSWDEVVTLTSLNAAISGASMLLTRNSYEHEYFGDDAEYCDPASVASIRNGLVRAWTTHDARAERRMRLADRVTREYNWERSAQITEEAYYRVLQHNPRRELRLTRFANLAGTA